MAAEMRIFDLDEEYKLSIAVSGESVSSTNTITMKSTDPVDCACHGMESLLMVLIAKGIVKLDDTRLESALQDAYEVIVNNLD